MMKFRMREIREAKGLSQEALGELLDLSGASISRFENGQSASVRKIYRAAEILGVSPAEFFEERPFSVVELERLFAAIPESDRQAVLDIARRLADRT